MEKQDLNLTILTKRILTLQTKVQVMIQTVVQTISHHLWYLVVCLTEQKEQDWSELDDQPVLPDFQEVVCVTSHFSDATEEIPYFSYFCDDEIIWHIESETNRYAGNVITAMKLKGSLKINHVRHKWSAVKLQEIYCFSVLVCICASSNCRKSVTIGQQTHFCRQDLRVNF
ncbi:uncharacterized protein LOC126234728 [Schistocerca nitens]|uniref:uncharacterized protein LOC126234728 n=1 Tax=Schistocerca nitens TaxID=7011 RepID=UPI0021193490|nr:uncharacterized protein LOC126234728 [Schistocerca nitens]